MCRCLWSTGYPAPHLRLSVYRQPGRLGGGSPEGHEGLPMPLILILLLILTVWISNASLSMLFLLHIRRLRDLLIAIVLLNILCAIVIGSLLSISLAPSPAFDLNVGFWIPLTTINFVESWPTI